MAARRAAAAMAVFFLLPPLTAGAAAPPPVSTDGQPPRLLRQAPFLFTHDAATGFMGEHGIQAPFFETQGADLPHQLSCGARALDIRVVLFADGSVHYHHGSADIFKWVSSQTLNDTLPALVQWARRHPSELVLLLLSHCEEQREGHIAWDSLDCRDPRLVQAFARAGIRHETDCGAIDQMTLADVEERAEMLSGGKMILLPGEGYCLEGNWQPEVNKVELVRPYVDRIMRRTHGTMFSVQALVQQTFEVPLTGSAALNPQVAEWAEGGEALKGVNLLEVNFVCIFGPTIARALGTAVTEEDEGTCRSACEAICKKYKCTPSGSLGTPYIFA